MRGHLISQVVYWAIMIPILLLTPIPVWCGIPIAVVIAVAAGVVAS